MKRDAGACAAFVCFVLLITGNTIISVHLLRDKVIRNTQLADIGTGYISFTAPSINGHAPGMLYRIMHNLTANWSLAGYCLLMASAVFFVSATSILTENKKQCYTIFAAVNVVFFALFIVSLLLPLGDLIQKLVH